MRTVAGPGCRRNEGRAPDAERALPWNNRSLTTGDACDDDGDAHDAGGAGANGVAGLCTGKRRDPSPSRHSSAGRGSGGGPAANGNADSAANALSRLPYSMQSQT
jgi:hypothetical protein